MRNKSILQNIDEKYDVLIVGGGIVGAGVFRDLALNGVKSLIIDKKDFSGQTSRSSSKMLHGGIRYLENFDFQLVWEALHEKNLWLKISPHLVREERFYLPVFNDSKRPLWMIKIGLLLYDILSSFSNSPHKIVNAQTTKEALPGLREHDLKGAGVYSDAIVDDLKLTLEVIYDALYEPKQSALNHVGITRFTQKKSYCECVLRDELTGEEKTIYSKKVVFATGPFTDALLPKLGIPWNSKLLPSKGSHLWIKKSSLPVESPLVITTKDDRIIFVIPHGQRILVGTTEEETHENFFDIKPSDQEIKYLIENLKSYFPNFEEKDSIIESFSGIRPLVADEDSQDPGKTSREHKVFRPYRNVYVLIGGKYTTFRVMAQDITREITTSLGLSYSSQESLRPLRQKSHVPCEEDDITLDEIKEMSSRIIQDELVRTSDDFVNRCLPWETSDGKREKLKKWLAKTELGQQMSETTNDKQGPTENEDQRESL